MHVAFVDNLLFEGTRASPRFDLQPHLGLMSLVAVAQRGGHAASIYDPKRDLAAGDLSLDDTLYGAMASRILDIGADVVGFTALGCNFQCVVRVAQTLRAARPDLPILLGGPHASILHRQILECFPDFDAVLRHEAEDTLIPALEGLEARAFDGLPGVSFRDRSGRVVCNPGKPTMTDLDRLPMPAYESYPIAEMGLTSLRVEAGRGCPFACTFCSTASFFGRNYRLKTPDRLLGEMRTLHRAYGVTDFQLNHDLFTVNRKKVLAFCDAVHGQGFTWRCSARVDCVDEELLEAMAAAGCRHIYFGIETGSQRMQEIARKRLDLALVEPALDVTSRLGIRTTTSFITGYPEEEDADQRQTLDRAGRYHHRGDGLNESQLHLLTPEPGTELIAKYGPELRIDDHVSGFNFPRIDSRDGAMLARNAELFPNHYHFPAAIPRDRHVFVTSAWIVLNEIGRTTFGYLLRAFDGSLARLMDEAYGWWREHGAGQAVDTGLLAFLADRFGPAHHLVSLVRHGVAVRAAASGPGPAGAETAGDLRDRPLALGPGVSILRRLHDCSTLLQRVAGDGGDGMLDDGEAGALADYLVVPAQSRAAVYRIDRPTADLIGRFRRATSYWGCCRDISKEPGALYPAWEDLERLCRLGVLQVANPVEALS